MMEFWIAAETDIGAKKRVNQDSLMVRSIETSEGNMVFAVLCDGMGGLQFGEIASSSVIMAFSDWMNRDLPALIHAGLSERELFRQWRGLLTVMNRRICDYGKANNCRTGTTVTALLLTDSRCFLLNIGDSRIYRLTSEGIEQLTEDHSWVADQVRAGKMTPEEARCSPKGNILTRCVGATDDCEPDCFSRENRSGDCYMLCSDGLRHRVSDAEIYETLYGLDSEETLCQAQRTLIDMNMQRGEKDNISVVTIYAR